MDFKMKNCHLLRKLYSCRSTNQVGVKNAPKISQYNRPRAVQPYETSNRSGDDNNQIRPYFAP